MKSSTSPNSFDFPEWIAHVVSTNVNRQSSVARIAYLSSDTVLSVQPALNANSEFSPHLHRYARNHASGVVCRTGFPDVHAVRSDTDPFLSAFAPVRQGRLTSITTEGRVLIRAVPHLYRLASFPVVIHVALQPTGFPDYAQITSVRNTGFAFLQSTTLQEAQDLALTAHALAIQSGKGVIHFFDPANSASDHPIASEDRELCARILNLDLVRRHQSTKSDDVGLYISEGKAKPSIGAELNQQRDRMPSTAEFPPNSVRSTPEDTRHTSRAPSLSSSDRPNGSSDDAGSTSESAATTVSSEPGPRGSDDIDSICSHIWSSIRDATGRSYSAFQYTGPQTAESALFLLGSDPGLFSAEFDHASPTDSFARVGLLTPTLYRPWLSERLHEALPSSVKRIAVLEQIRRKTTKWGPVLLDLLVALKSSASGSSAATASTPAIVGYQLGFIEESTVTQALSGIFQNLLSANPIQNLEIGAQDRGVAFAPSRQPPKLENAYMKVLSQIFGERLFIANFAVTPDDISRMRAVDAARTTPEFALGALKARTERRKRLVSEVRDAVRQGHAFTTANPVKWLEQWAQSDGQSVNQIAPEVVSRLATDGSPIAYSLLQSRHLFYKDSEWLIGSDAWAYDLGNSAVHHALASGDKVKMLIIDSEPFSDRAARDGARRKKDIGLYAMNFGNAYVASVAVYGSYTQVLRAFMEAEEFDGPAVVLAYLPSTREDDDPVAVLQETKRAIEVGYWPLYRWNPNAEDDAQGPEADAGRFRLDSERIKQELKEFLARDNQLSQLMRRHPQFHAGLSESYGTEVRATQKRRARQAYEALLEGLQGAPLTVLYASDNGNAESLAKRLANRGRARGLKTMCMAMDDYPLEDLGGEENLVCMTSTAGQGEFPQNGRAFWEGLKPGSSIGELDLVKVKFSVFALGDSHYWPRKEDRHYYNKPGKDLAVRLAALGANEMVEVGLGDDQDPDGYQTGYGAWEPALWEALGVGNVTGLPEEPPPLTNEDIKSDSNFLRGSIREGLADPSTGAISAADQQLTKFHGTYMQDDRDVRDTRKAQGLEPAYSFMIRCRLPGGVATPQQWLQMDDIAESLGNSTMKLTTRQTFQFHGVIKARLIPAMRAINRALMTTIAACGDVSRNVMCSALVPGNSRLRESANVMAKQISDHLLPSTTAYHEIWLQEGEDEVGAGDKKKVQVAGDAVKDFEPLYGPTYLPRKFKITIAIPPHNDTDVYAHDVGLIAIAGKSGDDQDELVGFNVLVGGGMGATHNVKATYPQIGRMLGYVAKADVALVCEKIMLVQRDHGDRKNRKHARLKYTVDDMGVDVFREKVEALMVGDERVTGKDATGLWTFSDAKPFAFESNVDSYGWRRDDRGKNHFTVFVENGRVEKSMHDGAAREGLREIAEALVHDGDGDEEFRLTGNQHVIIANVSDERVAQIQTLLEKHKLDTPTSTVVSAQAKSSDVEKTPAGLSGLRLSSSACVAFPTCGLAMAESERYLPHLITRLDTILHSLNLHNEPLIMRMTGCPNGCARPWIAEIALVGVAPKTYNCYLGGGFWGQRLGKLWRRNVGEEEVVKGLERLFKRWKAERRVLEENHGQGDVDLARRAERFGDWCVRAGVVRGTTEGRDFHDGVSFLFFSFPSFLFFSFLCLLIAKWLWLTSGLADWS